MKSFIIKNYSKGEYIIKEGEVGDKAFIIHRGEVEIIKKNKEGKNLLLATIGPGQMFGEMCLFDCKNRCASAVALTDVQLKVLYKENFLKFFSDTPQEVKLLFVLMLNRLRKTSELATLLSSISSDQSKQAELLTEKLRNLIYPS